VVESRSHVESAAGARAGVAAS